MSNPLDITSSVEIKFSMDYDKFKTLEGNRTIVPRKIKKLKESIQNGLDLVKYCPIIVNDKFEIIDGQHRFEVCKELGKPIFYVMLIDEVHVKQVAELNNNTDKWKALNYVECFEKQGSKDYKILHNFMDLTGYNYSIAAGLLMKNSIADCGTVVINVKAGNFKVKFENACMSFSLWINGVNKKFIIAPKSRSFVGAMKVLYDSNKFDIDVFNKKLELCGEELKSQATIKNCLYRIEEIYNFKNKIRVTIY